jgi:hypothetical protein
MIQPCSSSKVGFKVEIWLWPIDHSKIQLNTTWPCKETPTVTPLANGIISQSKTDRTQECLFLILLTWLKIIHLIKMECSLVFTQPYLKGLGKETDSIFHIGKVQFPIRGRDTTIRCSFHIIFYIEMTKYILHTAIPTHLQDYKICF